MNIMNKSKALYKLFTKKAKNENKESEKIYVTDNFHVEYKNEKEELVCGSSILFGRYFQEDMIHKTPIEWMVLEVKDGTALLMSKKALVVSGYCDYKKVSEDLKYLEWSHSIARRVCNWDFYDNAFSDEEKKRLV